MSFLSLVKTLNTFTPFMSQISNTIEELAHMSTHFSWDVEAQTEFDNIKQIMSQKLMINTFNPTIPIHLYFDAAKN